MLLVNGKEVFTTLEERVNPKHTALLLIDLQNDFVMPAGYFGKLGWDVSPLRQIVPRVRRVLQAARHSGVLIIHVQMTHTPILRLSRRLLCTLVYCGLFIKASTLLRRYPSIAAKVLGAGR